MNDGSLSGIFQTEIIGNKISIVLAAVRCLQSQPAKWDSSTRDRLIYAADIIINDRRSD